MRMRAARSSRLLPTAGAAQAQIQQPAAPLQAAPIPSPRAPAGRRTSRGCALTRCRSATAGTSPGSCSASAAATLSGSRPSRGRTSPWQTARGRCAAGARRVGALGSRETSCRSCRAVSRVQLLTCPATHSRAPCNRHQLPPFNCNQNVRVHALLTPSPTQNLLNLAGAPTLTIQSCECT